MNTVDAIEIVRDLAASSWHASAEERQAIEITARLVAAYDALAPDWSQAPEDAQWCVIDPTGDCYWHEVEPTPVSLSWESGTADFAGFVFVIPLGVDWRLLKWQRPEEPQP